MIGHLSVCSSLNPPKNIENGVDEGNVLVYPGLFQQARPLNLQTFE